MRERDKHPGSVRFFRLLGAVVIAGLSGACSSEVLRFSDSPFANPFSGRADTATTGSVSAPARKLSASSLGMPSSSALLQPMPSQGSTIEQAAMTQVAASGNAPVLGSVAGWTATGGTPVTLGAGDTVEKLSGRYGVPVQALRSINGLSGNSQPSAGQQFIIPAYNPGAKASSAAPAKVAPAKAEPATRATTRTEPVKAEPQKAATAKPRYESLKTVAKDDDDEDDKPAKAEKPRTPRYESLNKSAKAGETTKTKSSREEQQPLPPKKAEAKTKTDKARQTAKAEKAEVETKKTAKAEAPKAAAKEEPEVTASVSESQEFRWPARGRVISGYGSKGPGGTNDGINIAVPEGTPVKAAEGGTVAYVGEEIKGYGKMVLVRHPNGFVSAYAHNSDLSVKRGDTVKRGQVIAKSGQTGNVTSPQLHFELRKGAQPVDPSKFLEGN